VAHASVYSSRERWYNNSIPHTHTHTHARERWSIAGFRSTGLSKNIGNNAGPFFSFGDFAVGWELTAPYNNTGGCIHLRNICFFFSFLIELYTIFTLFSLYLKKSIKKTWNGISGEREILFPWKSWAEAERNAISTGGRWRDERAVERSRLPWRRRQAGSQRAGLKNQKHANSFTQRSTTKF
jgi:hypothetical protein